MYIKMNSIDKIKNRLNLEEDGKVQKTLTNSCYKHMDKYVPMSDLISAGDLRTVVDIQTDSITYESPYASYQYYGMREDGTHVVQNYTTPGTGSYWDERMVNVEINEVIKEVRESIGG